MPIKVTVDPTTAGIRTMLTEVADKLQRRSGSGGGSQFIQGRIAGVMVAVEHLRWLASRVEVEEQPAASADDACSRIAAIIHDRGWTRDGQRVAVLEDIEDVLAAAGYDTDSPVQVDQR
jgi:hypothetical protein